MCMISNRFTNSCEILCGCGCTQLKITEKVLKWRALIVLKDSKMSVFCMNILECLVLNCESWGNLWHDIRDGENEAHNPLDLVCGGCSAAACGHGVCAKGHGKEYIEFKCAYCCSPATYFCFGRTHFCDICHVSRPDVFKNLVAPDCPGPAWCPLQVPHLPNGQECCLGCSMCRFTGQWHWFVIDRCDRVQALNPLMTVQSWRFL